MLVVIFANGDIQDEPLVKQLIPVFHAGASNVFVIAADGGLRAALRYGLKPALIIGDMDSVTPEELSPFEADSDVTIVKRPAEKDETDLELALLWVAQHIDAGEVESITIIGGLGGRVDQTLANLYLLALPQLRGYDIRLIDGGQEIKLLRPGTHTIEGAQGNTISLIPLGGAVAGIHTDGLYYPLRGETLNFGPARGVSNVMTQDTATISLTDGALLLTHTLGRA